MSGAQAEPAGAATYSSAIAEAGRYHAWCLAPVLPYARGYIVEVGIGHGSYARTLGGLGRYTGLDIDPGSVAAARRACPESRFLRADVVADPLREALGGGADCIVCMNVLEHVADDRRAVENLAEALQPGGVLYLFLPAHRWLYNGLDRSAGHYRRYDRRALARLTEGLGLERLRLDYFNPVGALGWWVNGLLGASELDSGSVNMQIRVFDRLVLPVSRALDPMTRRLVGQSVIYLGRKM